MVVHDVNSNSMWASVRFLQCQAVRAQSDFSEVPGLEHTNEKLVGERKKSDIHRTVDINDS